MDAIQPILAMCLVLGLLGGSLWWLRRKGLAQFSRPGLGMGLGMGRSERRMQVVEKLSLAPGHSLHLVRVGDRTLLVASSPGGCALLEASGGDGVSRAPEPVR